MIKILNVITSMDPISGGMAQGIRNGIGQVNTANVTSEVLCLDEPTADFLSEDAFKIIALGGKRTAWGYSNPLKKWLEEHITAYDAVIVHGLWQYHGYLVRKLIKKLTAHHKKVPKYYVMPHGMLDPYFQKAPDRKFKALRNLLFWALIERKVVNDANGIFFTCQEELVLARETFSGYLPKNEYNVGYGVLLPPKNNPSDNVQFRKKHGLKEKEEFILFLSRIHRKKGLSNLLKAYSKCHEQHIKLPKLIIAGPGLEDKYGLTIKETVDSNPLLKQNVIFTGMIKGKEKWAAFNTATAFVLPSHQENFGIAVVEALACQCPVLISDRVNIWREIEQGNGGFVGEDTLAGTYNTLKQFAHLSLEDLEKLKQNAERVYQENFTIDRAAHEFLEVIQHDAV